MSKHHHDECVTCIEDEEDETKEKVIRLILSIFLLVIGFILHGNILFIVLSYVIIGYDVIKEAFEHFLNGLLGNIMRLLLL